MKLYGVRSSPYVRHTRIALAQSRLDWQFEPVTLDTINMSSTLRVPFLIDDPVTLSDSSVIVRYVREQAG
jgi:glutathione S-transferase